MKSWEFQEITKFSRCPLKFTTDSYIHADLRKTKRAQEMTQPSKLLKLKMLC